MTETALTLLRRDQRASGLPIREYERRYGLYLGDPGSDQPLGRVADIRKAEIHLSDAAATIGTAPHCTACARSLRNQRDHTERP